MKVEGSDIVEFDGEFINEKQDDESLNKIKMNHLLNNHKKYQELKDISGLSREKGVTEVNSRFYLNKEKISNLISTITSFTKSMTKDDETTFNEILDLLINFFSDKMPDNVDKLLSSLENLKKRLGG